MSRSNVRGTVYLIHFDVRYGTSSNLRGTAQHYIGWTENLEARLEEHRAGRGARLMAVIKDAGISWVVAATWPGRGNESDSSKNAAVPVAAARYAEE